MRGKASGPGRLVITFILLLLCVFALCATVLSAMGADIYKGIVERSNDDFELRTALSYITAKVRQGDEKGRVSISNIEGTDVLVISEEIEGGLYETYIFHKDEMLWELFFEKDSSVLLADAVSVMEIPSLTVEEVSPGVIMARAMSSGGRSESAVVTLSAMSEYEKKGGGP